jgi:calmodulin
MASLSPDILEDTLKEGGGGRGGGGKRRSKSTGTGEINADEFETCMESLGAVLTSREIQVVFSEICRASGGREDDGVVSADVVMSFIEGRDKKGGGRDKSPGRKGRNGRGEDSCLLSDSILADIEKSVQSFIKANRMALSKAIHSFAGADDRDKKKAAGTSNGSGVLSRTQFEKVLEHLGCQLMEEDIGLFFESLDVGGTGYVSCDELSLFCFTVAQGLDITAEAGGTLQQICSKKHLTAKDFAKQLVPQDKRRKGTVDVQAFEGALKTLVGSRNSVTPSQLSDLLRYLDPDEEGSIDIGIVTALVAGTLTGGRAEERLKHGLRLMRIKEIPYRGMFEEFDKTMSTRDMVDVCTRLKLPITETELFAVAAKHASRDQIKVKVLLEKLEADDKATRRYGRLQQPQAAKEIDFGKTMFHKLCKLRTDISKKDQFREALMSRDPDLNGRISIRDLTRCTDKFCEFTEAETGLLSENLCFVDGNFKKEIDYSLLLLVMHEPIRKSKAVFEAGSTLMEKMLRGSDSVSLRRLMALLFRNLAAADDRVSGMVTHGAAEAALKEECVGVDQKYINRILAAFLDESSDCVLYPEMLSYLSCCSLWNVMYRLHLVDRIRRKQGYNFSEFLVKYSAKHGKKLDREKTTDLFLGIGMLVPETALDTIFNKYAASDGVSMEAKAFAKGLADVESSDGGDDGAPHKKDRKDISSWGLTEDGKCAIQAELINKYHTRMLRAMALAFDIFDEKDTNQIASLDIERVLCALGQRATPAEIDNLLLRIDPNDTGMLEYNPFMDHVVQFVKEKYEDTFHISLEVLRTAFKVFDVNGDGTLSTNELTYVLTSQSDDITPEECRAMVEYLDVNQNGVVEWIEFVALHGLLLDDDAMFGLPTELRMALRKVSLLCLLTNWSDMRLTHYTHGYCSCNTRCCRILRNTCRCSPACLQTIAPLYWRRWRRIRPMHSATSCVPPNFCIR